MTVSREPSHRRPARSRPPARALPTIAIAPFDPSRLVYRKSRCASLAQRLSSFKCASVTPDIARQPSPIGSTCVSPSRWTARPVKPVNSFVMTIPRVSRVAASGPPDLRDRVDISGCDAADSRCALEGGAGGRRDILVAAEYVVRIEPALERAKALKSLNAKRGAHPIDRFVGIHIVDVCGPTE
jgi:hypothetical protein